MKSDLYKTIPDCPEKATAANVTVRMIDGLGFRYRLYTTGLDESFLKFCPVNGSMNGAELLDHVFRTAKWVYQSFVDKSFDPPKAADPLDLVEQALSILFDVRNHILDMDDKQFGQLEAHIYWSDERLPFWNLINGPIADMLTHVGQIGSWRRMMGNPVPKGNVFRGLPPEEE